MKNNYYDGTKLLSMKDLNGKTPELFLCTTNRTKHNKAPRAPTSPFEKAFNTIILYELTY